MTRLDPVEGSEEAGTRPAVIVSRDAINHSSPVLLVVPCTTDTGNRRIYPSQVRLKAPDGGLRVDSIALGEQIRAAAKSRLVSRLGSLSSVSLRRIDLALLIALDLSVPDGT